MTMWRLPYILTLSILLRASFLVYGLIQDKYSAFKYTDIDYLVFTDAARYVSQGRSPYLRETYRYTPLLAWILLPTTWQGFGRTWFSFGKILFATCDVVAGWLLYLILRTQGGDSKGKSGEMTEERALKYASVWLLNPMVITISTRGSSEGLLGVMVVAMLWSSMRRRATLTGFFLGLAVHFKIYPFIYAPSLLLYFSSPGRQPAASTFSARAQHFFNRDRTVLILTSFLTFAGLNLAMYAIYGSPFLQHTFLHHLTRIDHRHNFSPYHTLLYASSAASYSRTPKSSFLPSWLPALESLAFLPQLSLSAVLIPLVLTRLHLPSTLLAQTWAFVALNKVCTSQYFLWYLVLLPLYLPYSRFVAKPLLGILALGLWAGAQAWWLGEGYRLEFLGESRFVPRLWLAGLGFLAVNMWILGIVVGDVGSWNVGGADGEAKKIEAGREGGKVRDRG